MRSLLLAPLLLAVPSLMLVCCGDSPSGAGTNADAEPPDAVAVPDAGKDTGATSTSKVDILFVVDDSSSMADKSKLLGGSAGALLRRLAPLADIHVGVIGTSLGAMGGDICPNDGNFNRHARLLTKGPGGAEIAAAAKGWLEHTRSQDVDTFVSNAEALVTGVGQTGCGLEAQLESAYHFLVQPDPWDTVGVTASGLAEYGGIDEAILAQRAGFLRPDSLVAVVLLTDEDDSSVDPFSARGQGWAFANNTFPGSPVLRSDGKTTTAPRATSVCATNPGSPDCTSCGFAATCNKSDPQCQKIISDPECQKNAGYYGPTEEQINVRFHRMKQRFGIDPQYPITRYVDGFSQALIPDRAAEHDASGKYIGTAKCRNPLFAASLPTSSAEELCDRPPGARPPEFVVFVPIVGVPPTFVAGSPQWDKILGANPDAYDATGLDPHMAQSIAPRPGLPPPNSTAGDNGPDPIHGREWDTRGNDLQFACTFTLPAPRTCSISDPSCDCGGSLNPPLCSTTPGQQIKAKAYPGVRALRLAKELGSQAIVSSVCPPSGQTDYVAAMAALADKLTPKLIP